MYEYEDGEEGGRSLGRTIGIAIGVVAIAALGWFVVKPRLSSSEDPASGTATTVAESVLPPDGSTAGDGTTTSEPTVKSEKPVTSGPSVTTAPSTTAAPGTGAPTTATTAPRADAPYETLPDGSPAWVVVQYGPDSITLTGAVPDEAAKSHLEGLAVANAKDGQAATVTNSLTINPAIPRNVGVRVVELTSTRFPEGSAEVLPPHAAELDRIVNVMNLLPNINALVIGHADQRGDDLANYALSESRALAVKNYIASRGIAFDRLQSRAVGETDLLTLDDDDAALALNRRTEFVLYGLLLT